jgi:hypothetical protein
VDFFPRYEEAVEEPSLEGAVDLATIRTSRVGHRSFASTLKCGRDCTPDSSQSFIIQFQRANTLSFVALSGPQSAIEMEQAIEYARKHDKRIIAAVNAND